MLSHCPPGKETQDLLKHTPHVPGLWCLEHCRAGTASPRGRHRDLLQGSPTKLSWPHHSTSNFMMHSQELRKGFFCLKKESQCSQRAALASGTDIAVSLFNRWPGSHIANQVTHSEGISQMISYHVKFQPPKGFRFLISENRFKETC